MDKIITSELSLLSEKIEKFLKSISDDEISPIFPDIIGKDLYTPLDLSSTNQSLKETGFRKPDEYHDFIFNLINEKSAKVGFGGYFEKRDWYQESAHFGLEEQPRNIHLGLDLWVAAGTSVCTPLPGKIHSFNNNANYLDYGPTIIVEHSLDQQSDTSLKCYSLYGHLSLDSLTDKVIGQPLLAGDLIGKVGSSPSNGEWPPHLHFQVMIDLLGNKGDFPGVCSASDESYYRQICLDPILLFKL